MAKRKTIRHTFGYLNKHERGQTDAMLLQVGRVVVELSNVDHVLGFMYGMLGGEKAGERWRAYSEMRHFETRLKAVNRTVRTVCEPEQLRLWNSAYEKLTNSRPMRNRVAHLGMRRMFKHDRKNLGVELRPPWYLPGAAERALTTVEVRAAADLLVDAKADLWDFINTIAR
jgi:hypothetical protein